MLGFATATRSRMVTNMDLKEINVKTERAYIWEFKSRDIPARARVSQEKPRDRIAQFSVKLSRDAHTYLQFSKTFLQPARANKYGGTLKITNT